MMNQSFSREITAALLTEIREQMPEKIFFIKRRSLSEIGVCGFVLGSVELETLYFNVKDEGQTILVNPEIPTTEFDQTIKIAQSVAASFEQVRYETNEQTASA